MKIGNMKVGKVVLMAAFFVLPTVPLAAEQASLHWAKTFPGMGEGKQVSLQNDSTIACLTGGQLVVFEWDSASIDSIRLVATPFPPNSFLATDFGFVLIGNDTAGNGHLTAIDASGAILWGHSLPFSGTCITPTPDGGYLGGGGAGGSAWLIRLDGSGSVMWTKEYLSLDWASSVAALPAGTYVFASGNGVVCVAANGEKTSGGFSLGNDVTDQWSMSYDSWRVNNVKALAGSSFAYAAQYKKYKHNPTGLPGHEWGVRFDATNNGWLYHSESDDGRYVTLTHTAYDINVAIGDQFLALGTRRYNNETIPIIKLFERDGSYRKLLYSISSGSANYGIRPRHSLVVDQDCYIICGSHNGELWFAKIGPASKAGIQRHIIPASKGVVPQTYYSCPNPFRANSAIRFHVPSAGMCRPACELHIHNAAGRLVRSLPFVPKQNLEARVVWDGRDCSGKPMSTGVYMTQLNLGGKVFDAKAIVLQR